KRALQTVESPVLDETAVFFHKAHLFFYFFQFFAGQPVQVKFVPECAEISHVGSCIERSVPVQLMVRRHGYVASHAAYRITVGCAVLDLQPLDGVRIVARPSLRSVVEKPRIKASAAACTGFKQYMREPACEPLV